MDFIWEVLSVETTNVQKKRIFSGIQPTGQLTLGNYIGALRNFKLLENEYDCLYSIVDMHALTVRQNPADLRKACLRTMSIFLPADWIPKKTSSTSSLRCLSTRS